MALPLIDSFNIVTNSPIESSMRVEDLSERDNIPSFKRWEGMFTYVVSEGKYYSLNGGISNSDWQVWEFTGSVSQDWNDITNKPTEFTPEYHTHNYADIVDPPIIPVDISELSDNSGLLFDKDYNSLNNLPTIPTDINELTDSSSLLFSGDYNDLINQPSLDFIPLPTEGTNGQVLTTDGAGTYTWEDVTGSNSPITLENLSSLFSTSISAGQGATGAYNSNFLGVSAGQSATGAYNSNFLGYYAGQSATGASNSNFLGQGAGQGATGAYYSNFLGEGAGQGATNAFSSNFLGYYAGQGATNAFSSNFLGYYAGQDAADANNSNFIGYYAGQGATNASFSNFLGFKAGSNNGGNSIGTNNIIIGTNISLPAFTENSINIGGVLFGTNTHSTTSGNPSIIPTSNGRIGIGVVSPTAVLDLRASTTEDAVIRLRVGPAPTNPNDGDIWLESNTTTGLKMRIAGVTRTITMT